MTAESLSFGNWLQRELDRQNMRQADLHRATRFDRGSISNWINDKRIPDPPSCRIIANALGINEDVVLAAAGHRTLNVEPSRYRLEQEIRELRRLLGDRFHTWEEEARRGVVRIRRYGRVPADCVRWSNMEGDADTMEVLEAFLRGRSPERVFMVEASGDCLAARKIGDGDWVFCETLPRGQEPTNGDIVVIRVGDECSLKVWDRDGDWITLRDGDGQAVHRLSILDDFEIKGRYFARFG